jgi:predicted metal-binding protein
MENIQQKYENNNNTQTPLIDKTVDNLFGLSDTDFENILTNFDKYISTIDFKLLNTNEKLLSQFSQVESEIKTFLLKNYSHLTKQQIKILEFFKTQLLEQKFKSSENLLKEKITNAIDQTYDLNIDNIVNLKLYEHYFSNLKDLQNDEEILSKIDESFKEISDICLVIFESKVADLLQSKTIPKILIKKHLKKIKHKIKTIFHPMLNDLYHNFLESKIEVKLLKDYFVHYSKNEITIFDKFVIDEKLLYNLQHIFILSNIEYIGLDPIAKEVFLDGLEKYITIMQFREDNLDIEKRINMYLDTPAEDIKIYLSGHVQMMRDTVTYNIEIYFYIIMCFSFMLNNLLKVEANNIVLNDNILCNSRERQFLYNVLKIFAMHLGIDYDAFSINSYVQSIVISKTLKTFSVNLYDDDLKLKKELYLKEMLNIIGLEGGTNKDLSELYESIKPQLTEDTTFLKSLTNMLGSILCRGGSGYDIDINKVSILPNENMLISTNACICISGFTSEDSNHIHDWENLTYVLNKFIDFYFFRWPAETALNFLKDIGLIIGKTIFNIYTKSYFDLIADLKRYAHMDNMFLRTKAVAKLCGKLLALIIASRAIYNFQTITLSGFSLGTHVIKHCIKQLYLLSEKDSSLKNVIQNVVLVAGATSFKNKEKWANIFNVMIAGRIINCHGCNDSILRYLYQIVTMKTAIGLEMLHFDNCSKFENSDVSDLKIGHCQYRKMLDVILKRIKLYN